MINELKELGGRIDAIIKNDDYPSTIAPAYLRQAVKSYPEQGGKRIRPALLVWCCGLFGGNPETSLYPGAAVEIYHNWTLVHDDIIDADDLRRGKPTAHRALTDYALENIASDPATAGKFGRDMAILAGDLQQGWATSMMLKAALHGASPPVVAALTARLQEKVGIELISGEALDVEFSFLAPGNVSIAEVEQMNALKTGALLRFCAEAGALLALDSADFAQPQVRAVGDFAEALGAAFQLRDDWLGIFGDADKFGKRIGSDLAERKPTVMLLKALENAEPHERRQLADLLGRDDYPSAVMEQAKTLFRQTGAEQHILDRIARLSDAARSTLRQFPDNRYRKLLLELTEFLLARET